ncbi:hypothetical protein F4679DRAFT_578307 [Xylaria curta]|nr:hypothetical protein F4679DRAFT_578307 [Xylaria curta]
MISMSNCHEKSLNEDKSVASIGPGQLWFGVYSWLAQYGLAVNGGRYPMVGGWEVVLADGSIVNVTTSPEDPYSDLAWALRGGHNHSGIGAAAKEPLFATLDAYMAPGGGSDDPRSAINPASMLQFIDGEWVPGYLKVYMFADADENPHALKNFTNIPAEHIVFSSAALHNSWINIPNSLAAMTSQEDRTLF